MTVQGGAIQLVEQVDGRAVRGNVAIPVYGFTTADRPVRGGAALPVYIVSQAEVDAGTFRVQGGAAIPVALTSDLGMTRPVFGGAAVPIYSINGIPSGAAPPAAPTGLTAVQNGADVDLAWTNNAVGDGIKIYRSTDGVSYAEIDDIAAGSTSYTDLAIGTGTHFYYVAAYNDNGESDSNVDGVYPLDSLSNVAAAYSIRRLRKAYAGPLIRLRRDSDNTENDFGSGVLVELDAGAIAAWLAGANGYAATWYDQSGNGRNLVQATADNQPLYVAAGPNSKPTIRYDGINDRLRVTFADIGSTHHIFSAFKLVSWTDGRYLFSGGNTFQISVYERSSAFLARMISGPEGSLVDFGNVYNIGTFYFATVPTTYVRRNGTQTNNGSTIGTASCTGIVLGARWDQTLFGNVDFSEHVLFSAEQVNAPVEADMGDYYGITVV